MFGYKYSRLTIFHVILFTGLAAGLFGGVILGKKCFGIPGMIIGGIVGAVLGMAPNFAIESWASNNFFKDLKESSNEKLRANLEQEHWNLLQTMSLLQLAARDQDIEPYFNRVLTMLQDDSPRTREFGYDALRIAFTEKMKLSPDYTLWNPPKPAGIKLNTCGSPEEPALCGLDSMPASGRNAT